jgi:hypothetical protein
MSHRQTILSFPELRLPASEGHRLRGYFGNAFKQHSPLLHNHLEDGSLRNGYPLVQYKMIRRIPTIVGLDDGADLLLELFSDIEEIRIADQVLDARAKQLSHQQIKPTFLSEDLISYQLESPYRGISQDQYPRWRALDTDEERFVFVQKSLIGHLLMVFKGLNIWLSEHERIIAYPRFQTILVKMKGIKVTAFTGDFVTNVSLPDYIGIGKGTSRGYGVIRRMPGAIGPPFEQFSTEE